MNLCQALSREHAPRAVIGLAVVALFVLSSGGSPPYANEPLRLRVHDAIGVPDGEIAIVLRTYAARPIGQGQVCIEAPGSGDQEPPLSELEGSAVFSDSSDASSDASGNLAGDPQQIVLQFASPSATINVTDGPLAVVFLKLDDDVEPGEAYALRVDLAGTSLTGDEGEAIEIEPRSGSLTIRAPSDPISVEADGEDTNPGAPALLSMATFEPIRLSAGRVGLRYDPAIADGPPSVSIDPRHGSATFTTSTPEPGLVVVDFHSPDASLNEVPGDLVEVLLSTDDNVPPGTASPVSLDPRWTFLRDASGQLLTLRMEDGVLQFGDRAPGAVADLRIEKLSPGMLELSWSPDCGSANTYAVYRGDLPSGYGSLALEPGRCDIGTTTTTVDEGTGDADFFLVVPHVDGFEGGYGVDSSGCSRVPASTVCYPQGDRADCTP